MQVNLFISNFKKKIADFKKTTTIEFRHGSIFFLVLILILTLIGNYFELNSISQESDNFYPKMRWNEFYELENESVDILFIGSSHACQSFDPEIFDSELGIRTFNLGSAFQSLSTSYYVLKECMSYQNPKVIFLEVYWKVMEKDLNDKQLFYNYNYMKESNIKKDIYNDLFDYREKIKDGVKILKYKDNFNAFLNNKFSAMITGIMNNKAQSSILAEDKNDDGEYYKGKGFIYNNKTVNSEDLVNKNEFKNYSIDLDNISALELSYFDEIIFLCKESNIDLILVTAPMPEISVENIDNYDKFHDYIEFIAESNKLEYLDYNLHMEGIEFDVSDFKDDNHLNYTGVIKFNNHLIDYLTDLISSNRKFSLHYKNEGI